MSDYLDNTDNWDAFDEHSGESEGAGSEVERLATVAQLGDEVQRVSRMAQHYAKRFMEIDERLDHLEAYMGALVDEADRAAFRQGVDYGERQDVPGFGGDVSDQHERIVDALDDGSLRMDSIEETVSMSDAMWKRIIEAIAAPEGAVPVTVYDEFFDERTGRLHAEIEIVPDDVPAGPVNPERGTARLPVEAYVIPRTEPGEQGGQP